MQSTNKITNKSANERPFAIAINTKIVDCIWRNVILNYTKRIFLLNHINLTWKPANLLARRRLFTSVFVSSLFYLTGTQLGKLICVQNDRCGVIVPAALFVFVFVSRYHVVCVFFFCLRKSSGPNEICDFDVNSKSREYPRSLTFPSLFYGDNAMRPTSLSIRHSAKRISRNFRKQIGSRRYRCTVCGCSRLTSWLPIRPDLPWISRGKLASFALSM